MDADFLNQTVCSKCGENDEEIIGRMGFCTSCGEYSVKTIGQLIDILNEQCSMDEYTANTATYEEEEEDISNYFTSQSIEDLIDYEDSDF